VVANSQVKETAYRSILGRAWPIILANSAAPLLGLADTAVIGRTGSTAALGAIALGSLIFSFVYWTFGFLRMGTTGFVAQAHGCGEEVEVRAALGRAALMGTVIGLGLIAVQVPVFRVALSLLSGSEEVETTAEIYLKLRIWGAPATLASYALTGGLIGLGRSRTLLVVQVFLNALNIGLDVLFAGYLGMGVAGIALGTMIAEWTATFLALFLMVRILKSRHRDKSAFWPWSRITDSRRLLRTFAVQLDLMIRTLSLLVGFGWFTQQGARLGDATLAANHILLQFISLSAFFLDGFAFATEALVGTAAGGRRIVVFDILVRRTTILAAATALLLAAGLFVFGSGIIRALTNLEEVRLAGVGVLHFAVTYVAAAFAAFQLDGIYIGVTRTRDMRNAALVSLAIFLGVGWPLTNHFGNAGLWLAFNTYVIARAATLAVRYPRLRREIGH
jgi:MATE family multidrug resistance protein